MATPISFYSETINDNSIKSNGQPESSNWRVPISTLSAANFTAKKALIDALQAAVDDIVIGNKATTDITFEKLLVSTTAAASKLAQRENKWLCRYHGASLNKKFQVSIPTADLTVLPDHSEFIDLSTGVGAALKAAFEAIVVSPDNSAEAVVLDSVQFVGRNN